MIAKVVSITDTHNSAKAAVMIRDTLAPDSKYWMAAVTPGSGVIAELHLRQSRDNIWTEAMCDGDIDYEAMAKYLLKINVRPHLVMEQAVEAGLPKTMSTIEASRKSSQYARQIFAAFA